MLCAFFGTFHFLSKAKFMLAFTVLLRRFRALGLGVSVIAVLAASGCSKDDPITADSTGLKPVDEAPTDPATENATPTPPDTPPSNGDTPTDPPVKPPTNPDFNKSDDLEIPETLEDLVAFVKDLGERRPDGATREEIQASFLKIHHVRLTAADKALTQTTDPEKRADLIESKLESFGMLAQLGDSAVEKQVRTLLATLENETSPRLKKIARSFDMQLKTESFVAGDLKPEEMLASLKAFIESGDRDEGDFTVIQNVLQVMQQEPSAADSMSTAFAMVGDAFKDSENAEIAGGAKMLVLVAKMIPLQEQLKDLMDGKPGADKLFLAGFQQVLQDTPPSIELLQMASQITQSLEYSGQIDPAKTMLAAIQTAFVDVKDPNLLKAVETSLGGALKRVSLVGQPFSVEGTLVDGTPFDWSQYKGKYVLVDFWATWCRPCLAEFPNIKANYEKYKSKGFEVVAINLDDDLGAVKQFLEQGGPHWPSVVDPKATGFKNPLAVRCGVSAIPFILLVGPDGTVINIHVRGPKLGERLAELLGEPAAPPAPAPGLEDPAGSQGDEGEAGDEGEEGDDDSNPYAADSSLSPAELVDFLFDMEEKPLSIQQRPGFTEAIVDAAERLVKSDKASDKQQQLGVLAKFRVLQNDASFGDEEADKQLVAFLETMKDDTRKKVAREVAFLQLERKTIDAKQLDAEKVPALVDDVANYLETQDTTGKHLRMASMTVRAINGLADKEEREELYKKLGGILASSSDREVSRYGKRLNKGPGGNSLDALVGKPLEVAGQTTLGDDLVWDSYRGKVVIVDFWATWCGPCIKELPAIKKVLAEKGEAGLEVVGVNLDKEPEALAKFLDENELPWTTVTGETAQQTAKTYGISAIPTLILVDREGNVVAVEHHVAKFADKMKEALEK